MSDGLLRIENLSVEYSGRRRRSGTLAVDDVSFDVREGESVGLVGESGSGKTSLGSAVLGLAPATGGRIRYGGEDITHARPARRRALSAEIQVIFQDPYSSLNPLRTVGETLAEPLWVHGPAARREVPRRVGEMLEQVGLDGRAGAFYPSQFSGGQRQRIAIARALMVSPRLVICDEAVSALDLSVQAQVLNLLLDLQEQMSLSYLFISHDLDVVRHMTERLVVLFRGRVVESGSTAEVTKAPRHPYTRALLASVPLPEPQEQARRRAVRPRDASSEEAELAGLCPPGYEAG
jgi:ABC-type glutathione transport system ATPase component